MAKTYYILMPNLQIFAEGAAVGAGAGSAGGVAAEGTTGDTAAAAGQQTRRGVKNPLADVQYGKGHAEDTVTVGAQAAAVQEPDADAAFEAMIRGEYKEAFDKRVQSIVQNRLKSSKDTVDKYTKLTPVIEMLSQKYHVDANDADALSKAIEEDDAYYEEEALERGISVEDLKGIKKMERENAALKQQIENAKREQQIEKDVAKWMHDAEEAKKVFPGFDLNTELENPNFMQLLQSGIDVQTAYWAIHNRELVPQMLQYTAQKTQAQVAQNLQAQGRRPAENGGGSNSAAVVKPDVKMLTKADREEIARRVARGERIVF